MCIRDRYGGCDIEAQRLNEDHQRTGQDAGGAHWEIDIEESSPGMSAQTQTGIEIARTYTLHGAV